MSFYVSWYSLQKAHFLNYAYVKPQLKNKTKIAIVGGGPSGLFMYKRLIEEADSTYSIDIFEKNEKLGAGMPYSIHGANEEHITNVSGNEIPKLVTDIQEWISTVDDHILQRYGIDVENFHNYKVLPRLLFGQYLADQFKLLQQSAAKLKIETNVFYKAEVTDIADDEDAKKVSVYSAGQCFIYDRVIICSGHYWPSKYEHQFKGCFDSPYPPSKFKSVQHAAIAIKGASLTAIDAVRTLARQHGVFERTNGQVIYRLNHTDTSFKIIMHSRNGLLPAVRFHLDDSTLGRESVMTREEIEIIRGDNDGFLPLDVVFERNFKIPIREMHPEFYSRIKEMNVEEFVGMIMEMRERIPPFDLFKAEYTEAEKSIKRKQSVYWKEMLAVLSFTMNYPAKYFSAEDMIRIRRTLLPLISLVIAFVPQSSAEELIALHNADVLDLIGVGEHSTVDPNPDGGIVYKYRDENGTECAVNYATFIDCTGQPHLDYEDFPFSTLRKNGVISPAMLKFRSAKVGNDEMENGNKLVRSDECGNYYLSVPGIAINDSFQVLDKYNAYNERVYIMAVPFIGGFNPDYSGLDFCETASLAIVKGILRSLKI